MDDGQLDNPYSGRVSAGNYTEVVTTKVRRLGLARGWGGGALEKVAKRLVSKFAVVLVSLSDGPKWVPPHHPHRLSTTGQRWSWMAPFQEQQDALRTPIVLVPD